MIVSETGNGLVFCPWGLRGMVPGPFGECWLCTWMLFANVTALGVERLGLTPQKYFLPLCATTQMNTHAPTQKFKPGFINRLFFASTCCVCGTFAVIPVHVIVLLLEAISLYHF